VALQSHCWGTGLVVAVRLPVYFSAGLGEISYLQWQCVAQRPHRVQMPEAQEHRMPHSWIRCLSQHGQIGMAVLTGSRSPS
jgi:hypothetical protein